MKSKSKLVFSTLIGIAAIFVLLAALLTYVVYASGAEIPVVNTKGAIAHDERDLLRDSTFLMLLVVVPVFIMTFLFFWRYREDNQNSTYNPDYDRSPVLEIAWWGVPCVIILVLSVLTWVRTHELNPFTPLDSDVKPVKIQVVALDWKWLFIYPEERIATVNYVQFPEKTPLNLSITADAPMNSFWLPALGGQMYAMPGMASKLHLIADAPGEFRGVSANLSGKGFAGMNFRAKASSNAHFQDWVRTVKATGKRLDRKSYMKLAEPSEYVPASTYVLEDDGLFDWIVTKYMKP